VSTYQLSELDEYSIIVPQVTRMWDNTWDVIVNDQYLMEEPSHQNYFNRDPYLLYRPDHVQLSPIDTFKFAGWGTCFKTKLREIVDIPDPLGSYGVDDTFIASACTILKSKGVKVQQYVLDGEIIIENNKYRYNPYKDYLVSIDKREEFLAKAHSNYYTELQKYF
jgi:hypothetical protein